MNLEGRKPILDQNCEKTQKLFYTFGGFRATHETMGGILGCSHDTIQRTFKDEDNLLCVAYKKGFAELKRKLSEAQIATAIEDRNPTLLVWLGKQYLGQTDKPGNDDDTKPETVAFDFEAI